MVTAFSLGLSIWLLERYPQCLSLLRVIVKALILNGHYSSGVWITQPLEATMDACFLSPLW
ncbi:hypothetical protein PSEUDO8Z_190078 [Pseudomonas sp. 8Z]|nr:hypothetical protein PSEUDO8Z_190078 [Pseudomonas sp. 8Z]